MVKHISEEAETILAALCEPGDETDTIDAAIHADAMYELWRFGLARLGGTLAKPTFEVTPEGMAFAREHGIAVGS